MSVASSPPSNARFKPLKIYATGACACAALAAGFYFAALSPALARRADQAALREQLESQEDRLTSAGAANAEVRHQLTDTRTALAALPLKLEDATAANQRLARLTNVAHACTLRLDEIRPGVVEAGADYYSVPITIVGAGSYPACATFLHRLHLEFPDTAVKAFNATRGTNESSATFTFDLVWHTAPAAR